jgi:hypothetical protein
MLSCVPVIFFQRGAASIYRIRNSIADISPAPSPDTSSPIMFTVSQQLRTLSNTARVDADKGMYVGCFSFHCVLSCVDAQEHSPATV